MLFAAKELEKMHGGIIVVKDKTVLAQIKLEIGGLMTNSYTLLMQMHSLFSLGCAVYIQLRMKS